MQKRTNGSLWLGLAMGAMLLTASQAFACQNANDQAQVQSKQNQNTPQNQANQATTQNQNQIQRGQSGFRGTNNQATPWLGVLLQEKQTGQAGEPGQNENEQGVRVLRTYPSGPAARAGVFSGDQILQIDGKEVDSADDVAQVISSDKPNQQITLTVLRNGEQQQLNATLADRGDFIPNQPTQGQGNNLDDNSQDHFSNVPGHAMMLEQHRHFAEQHQRIEQKLDQLLKEVNQLQKRLDQVQGQGQTEGAEK